MVLVYFGIILLVMTFIAGRFMKKEATDPNCSEDVKDVTTNKRLYRLFLIIAACMIVAGGIVELVKLF